jgi:DNA-directed RNA polymerase subunit RPC12/RpoP
MAILRCNKCGLLAEQVDTHAGHEITCPKCGTLAMVYPTLFFIEKLLDKYFVAQRELIALKSRPATRTATDLPATQAAPLLHTEIDLGNTDKLATELQHGPIYDWFHKKQIKVQADMRSVDTSGFFDEVAEAIGGNLELFKEVIERLRWSQQKDHSSATIRLDKRSPEEAKALSSFCQQLYDFSFVAKCFHNKPENNIRLILQTAPAIRRFFDGEWLEWHALMCCLRYAKERNRRFSCARGLEISLANDDRYELDVFMLIDGNTPICIECKSGEFRQNIDRYLALRKRLGISGKNFVMCVAGLSDENTKAFSAMYDLAFVNERGLAEHLGRLF